MKREKTDWTTLAAEIGKRIAKARAAKHLTQTELAERAHLSRTSLVLIEIGQQGIRLNRLFEIARELGKEPAELLPKLKDVFFETNRPSSPQEKLKLSEEKKIESIINQKGGQKYAE
jgi:transcriptional regulator with XRE-family HTH domain